MRNVEKKSAEMAAQVEQARKALASAEQNRDAKEKALAEARSHFHKTQQEYFARFPSGCPLDNDVGAGQVVEPMAAAGIKDASGDVAVGEVDGVVIELPEDADEETKDLWQQHRELKKRMLQFRREIEEKWVVKRPSAERSRLLICKRLWQKPPRRLQGRRIFDRSADDEEILSSEQDAKLHFLFVCQPHVFGCSCREIRCGTNVMTITLCHLLSRIYFVTEIRVKKNL